jgi:hypothetical protein
MKSLNKGIPIKVPEAGGESGGLPPSPKNLRGSGKTMTEPSMKANADKARTYRDEDPADTKCKYTGTMGDGKPSRMMHNNTMGRGEREPRSRNVMGDGQVKPKAKGAMGKDL